MSNNQQRGRGRGNFRPNQQVRQIERTDEERPNVGNPREGISQAATANTGSNRDRRNTERAEKFREKASNNTTQQNKDALFDKLFYGYTNISETMKNISLTQANRTIDLSISTRGLGFTIRQMVSKFHQMNCIPDIYATTNALYRISLLQLDLKLIKARENHFGLRSVHGFYHPTMDYSVEQALKSMGASFAPITNYISSIGLLKTTEVSYLPQFLLVNPGVSDANNIYMDNLRVLVERLSNPITPLEVRRAFFMKCPIPGARWTITPGQRRRHNEEDMVNVILQNPDDIIPAEYDIADIRADIDLIAGNIEVLGRKFPKYICTGGVDYAGAGQMTMLVSSDRDNNLRCLPFPTLDPRPALIPSLAGEYNDFWTPRSLSSPEAYLGCLYLVGEMSNYEAHIQHQTIRDRKTAIATFQVDYPTIIQNLLN